MQVFVTSDCSVGQLSQRLCLGSADWHHTDVILYKGGISSSRSLIAADYLISEQKYFPILKVFAFLILFLN